MSTVNCQLSIRRSRSNTNSPVPAAFPRSKPRNFTPDKIVLEFSKKVCYNTPTAQGSYIGNTTASQAVKAGSTPVPCSIPRLHRCSCGAEFLCDFCAIPVLCELFCSISHTAIQNSGSLSGIYEVSSLAFLPVDHLGTWIYRTSRGFFSCFFPTLMVTW